MWTDNDGVYALHYLYQNLSIAQMTRYQQIKYTSYTMIFVFFSFVQHTIFQWAIFKHVRIQFRFDFEVPQLFIPLYNVLMMVEQWHEWRVQWGEGGGRDRQLLKCVHFRFMCIICDRCIYANRYDISNQQCMNIQKRCFTFDTVSLIPFFNFSTHNI